MIKQFIAQNRPLNSGTLLEVEFLGPHLAVGYGTTADAKWLFRVTAPNEGLNIGDAGGPYMSITIDFSNESLGLTNYLVNCAGTIELAGTAITDIPNIQAQADEGFLCVYPEDPVLGGAINSKLIYDPNTIINNITIECQRGDEDPEDKKYTVVQDFVVKDRLRNFILNMTPIGDNMAIYGTLESIIKNDVGTSQTSSTYTYNSDQDYFMNVLIETSSFETESPVYYQLQLDNNAGTGYENGIRFSAFSFNKQYGEVQHSDKFNCAPTGSSSLTISSLTFDLSTMGSFAICKGTQFKQVDLYIDQSSLATNQKLILSQGGFTGEFRLNNTYEIPSLRFTTPSLKVLSLHPEELQNEVSDPFTCGLVLHSSQTGVKGNSRNYYYSTYKDEEVYSDGSMYASPGTWMMDDLTLYWQLFDPSTDYTDGVNKIIVHIV